MSEILKMGAVAYAPKVVTIWEGFKEFFFENGLNFDYIMYSNYEAQVEAQFRGEIHVAWNSPLAWLRAEKIAKAQNKKIEAIAMRDTDQNLRSVLVVKKGSTIANDVNQLKGKIIGFGAVDSPQATLIPKQHLKQKGFSIGADYTEKRFDVLGGKHGDHIGGERDAAIALMKDEIDAAWMIDGNYAAFSKEGILPSGETEVVMETDLYDHCNFTTSPDAPIELLNKFTELLFAMKWEDEKVRPLLELEGLQKWVPGRVSHYKLLDDANSLVGFYDDKGNIVVQDYRY